ncbi:MAG: metallophosphoesterase, partial [Bacillota bacterium]|nr:metallophosphoesterase [Bacillota bacterium]
MKTLSRLDSVFANAMPVSFDDESKFVFFGDTHRGDDSLSDEFGRNKHIFCHALNYYYENDFTYVEVGDGDELWEQPRYDYIRNAHFITFKILKRFYDAGRFYMLFGNHNMQLKSPDYVRENLYYVYDEYLGTDTELFPGLEVPEALLLTHRETGQEIFVVHGHQGDFLNDQLAGLARLMVRFLWHSLHIVGVRYAASPTKSRRRRHKVERNYTRWNRAHNKIIICGHTHRPRFPDPGQGSYFNTGCCMHPRGITCIELSQGQLTLVTWRVSTRRDGAMYIKRTALKGPEPI